MAGTERVGLKTKSSGGQAGLNLSSGMSLSVENPQSRITPLPRPAHRRRPQEAENEVTKRNVDLKMKRHRDGVYPVSRLTTDPSFPRCVYSPSNHAESVKAQHPWCAFIYLTCYNAVLMAFDRNHIEDSAWREAIHQLFRFPLEPVTQNNYVLPSAFTPWLSSWIDRVYGYVWKLENGDRTGMRACFCTHQSQHAYSYLPNFDILADYSLLSKALSQNAHRGV